MKNKSILNYYKFNKMNGSIQDPKELIIKHFYLRKTDLPKDLELDDEIRDFIYDVNKSPNIYTENSCQGHKHKNSIDLPYLGFLVNETGWDIFWSKTLPLIAYGNAPSIGNHVDISISSFQEDDIYYGGIILTCPYFNKRDEFWDIVIKSFNETFLKDI